jgi:hypothetical protein
MKISEGDVIQIAPGGTLEWCDHCFAIVTEVKKWGVIAFVFGKEQSTPVRITDRNYAYIGKAKWK